jgi:hypothetical protein
MEPEILEQEEQPYRVDPRRAFTTQMKRSSERAFKESFGAEINFDEVEEEFAHIDAMEEIVATKVKEPSFPFFTFYIALCLDVLDIVQFTGVGWFVVVIVNIVFSIILFILMFRKTDTMFKAVSKGLFRGKRKNGSRRRGKSIAQRGLNKFAVKYLKKYISRRLLGILVLNVIPGIGIFASNAFFVVLAHNKQKKIAQKYVALIKMISGILKKAERRRGE